MVDERQHDDLARGRSSRLLFWKLTNPVLALAAVSRLGGEYLCIYTLKF